MKTLTYYLIKDFEQAFIVACKWKGIMYEQVNEHFVDGQAMVSYKIVYKDEYDLIMLGSKMQLEFALTYKVGQA